MIKKKIVPSAKKAAEKLNPPIEQDASSSISLEEQEFWLRLEIQELIATTRQASEIQKELTSQFQGLTSAVKLIVEHEFTQIHRSKWRIILYQISLWILFAIGTVLWLALFSWSVYTFFKDSQILRQIVDKQLNSRNFNFTEIRDKASKDAK